MAIYQFIPINDAFIQNIFVGKHIIESHHFGIFQKEALNNFYQIAVQGIIAVKPCRQNPFGKRPFHRADDIRNKTTCNLLHRSVSIHIIHRARILKDSTINVHIQIARNKIRESPVPSSGSLLKRFRRVVVKKNQPLERLASLISYGRQTKLFEHTKSVKQVFRFTDSRGLSLLQRRQWQIKPRQNIMAECHLNNLCFIIDIRWCRLNNNLNHS